MFTNLAVNAFDAMPGGGTLRFTVEAPDPRTAGPDASVSLRVSDTGCGIDPQIVPKVFDPFFTTKEMGRGTGLGLASVYGIIKSHGGYIDVRSEKEKGTTFTILLPASEKEPVMESTAPADWSKRFGTILLIDDERMILDVGCELLEELGYTVLSAVSGKEALEIFKKNSIEGGYLNIITQLFISKPNFLTFNVY